MDGTILVMDYSQFEREKAKHALRNSGDFKILEIADKASAIGFLEEPAIISLAIMDIAFPTESEGFLLLERFRSIEAFKNVPVIITTRNNTPECKMRASRLSASDYIIKPYHFSRLEESVKSVAPPEKDISFQITDLDKTSMTFEEYIERELKLASRYNTCLSLVLMAPSGLSGTDSNGSLADRIRQNLRVTDLILVNGQKDIILILPGTGAEGAKAVIDKLSSPGDGSPIVPAAYHKACVSFPEDGRTLRALMESAVRRVTGKAFLDETASIPANKRIYADNLYQRFKVWF